MRATELDNVLRDSPERNAAISFCGKYRYLLSRVWDASRPLVNFIGLNPSTADAEQDDPTVRRMIGFARREGFGGLLLTNLFAFRATDPRELSTTDGFSPVGPYNDEWIVAASARAKMVVVAWGSNAAGRDRGESVISLLRSYRRVAFCFGLTRTGHPLHPLYLRADQPLGIHKSFVSILI